MTRTSRHKGFTLIETLVYIGLYAIIMAGAVISMYTLFESGERNQTKAMVQEEGNFLLAKVDWALTGARTINLPVAGASGKTLSVTKWDTAAGNPVVITISNGSMTMSRSGNPAVVLNNADVQIICPTANCFTHSSASGDGINQENATATFSVHATTTNGLSFSQEFSTTKYIRR
jgi:type II secretory pathway pseudopilin PulG